MIKALLIGCGNIGAGYDLDSTTKVWSHAKAYVKTEGIALTVFDLDSEKAKAVADNYHVNFLADLADSSFKSFDIVSITTPTPTHFHFLSKALRANVAVIICEKPVVSTSQEADALEQLYQASESSVLVNYIRRFQPEYQKAKDKLLVLQQEQRLQSVVVKYKQGFLNNASHAIDLIEFFV